MKLLKWLMRWPPNWAYFFANVIIITQGGKIILSRSEDREQFTPYGGEVELEKGEQPNEAAAREVKEETAGRVNPEPDDLILLDSAIVFSHKNGDGINRGINTYVYFMKETDQMPNISDQEHEKGCRIVDVMCTTAGELDELIKQGIIKIYPNFEPTLEKLYKMFRFLDNRKNI